jgi:hypothetical protein
VERSGAYRRLNAICGNSRSTRRNSFGNIFVIRQLRRCVGAAACWNFFGTGLQIVRVHRSAIFPLFLPINRW